MASTRLEKLLLPSVNVCTKILRRGKGFWIPMGKDMVWVKGILDRTQRFCVWFASSIENKYSSCAETTNALSKHQHEIGNQITTYHSPLQLLFAVLQEHHPSASSAYHPAPSFVVHLYLELRTTESGVIPVRRWRFDQYCRLAGLGSTRRCVLERRLGLLGVVGRAHGVGRRFRQAMGRGRRMSALRMKLDRDSYPEQLGRGRRISSFIKHKNEAREGYENSLRYLKWDACIPMCRKFVLLRRVRIQSPDSPFEVSMQSITNRIIRIRTKKNTPFIQGYLPHIDPLW